MIELTRFPYRDPRWLNLIQQDPAATIFDHPAWMELLAACYGYRPFIFALQEDGGRVCAALPVAEIKDYITSHRYVALPFTDYCAPLTRDENALLLLLDKLVEQQMTKKIPRLEIRSGLPALDGIQERTVFVKHSVPLEPDSTKVAKRVSRQQMQNVRTAENNGIRVVRGTGLAEIREFYRLNCLNRRKHGVPAQPWSFFNLLAHTLFEQDLGFVLLAYKDDICISAGLFLHWQKTLTYKYSATDENALNLRPNHLVTWTAMKWGCENGFTTFDFGRAEQEDEGLRSYKRRWGANETPLAYSYLPSAPAQSAQMSGKLGGMLKKIIQQSPVWLGQAVGQIMYRYVG
jgi:lipid II:glycine glycyltransferase (peptidoglycan interpeptide bridge formation enzyme)